MNAQDIRSAGRALTLEQLEQLDNHFRQNIGGVYNVIAAAIREQHPHLVDSSVHVCAPDHLHEGSGNCYSHHRCHCSPCVSRFNARRRENYRLRIEGRYQSQLHYTSSTGTRRRLQALQANGWSQRIIAARLGIPQSQVTRQTISPQRLVFVSTHERVSELFEELWNKVPPRETTAQKFAYSRLRNHARRQGWLPPMAWDDIDTDVEPPVAETEEALIDEVAVELACRGHHPKLTMLERHEATRILAARGMSDSQIGRLLDVAEETVFRNRQALGIPSMVPADHMSIAS